MERKSTDKQRFAPRWHTTLRRAVAEFSWLLTRGYSERAALKLVGDRHGIDARQREAVVRCSCGDQALEHRLRRRHTGALTGRGVVLDGLNLLITLETALDDGLILRGRDGCLRDLAGVHGSYRARPTDGAPTLRAIHGLRRALDPLEAAEVLWLLDRPVSNSGQLAALLRSAGDPRWSVELTSDPDQRISAMRDWIAATSDGGVLDRCASWIDLLSPAVAELCPGSWLLDLDS